MIIFWAALRIYTADFKKVNTFIATTKMLTNYIGSLFEAAKHKTKFSEAMWKSVIRCPHRLFFRQAANGFVLSTFYSFVTKAE